MKTETLNKKQTESFKPIVTSSTTGNIISSQTEDSLDETLSNDNLLLSLNSYRQKHKDKLIFSTFNINSLRYKIDELRLIAMGNIDVLVVNETKLDSTFPIDEFSIKGFCEPFRLDRTDSGGGTTIYVRDDISCKELDRHSFPSDVEGIFIELNLKKYKILLLGTYSPPSQNKSYFLNSLSNSLDLYINNYEKFILLGDFNMNVRTSIEPILSDFLDRYEAKNLVKDPTCFKSIENPSKIDLIISNFHRSFIKTKSFHNCLSDFHRIVFQILRTPSLENECFV